MLRQHLVDESAFGTILSQRGKQLRGLPCLNRILFNKTNVREHACHRLTELLLACIGMSDEGEADAEVLEWHMRKFGTTTVELYLIK